MLEMICVTGGVGASIYVRGIVCDLHEDIAGIERTMDSACVSSCSRSLA